MSATYIKHMKRCKPYPIIIIMDVYDFNDPTHQLPSSRHFDMANPKYPHNSETYKDTKELLPFIELPDK